MGTVRGVYEAFGLSLSAEAEAVVKAIDEEARTGHAKPSHRYSLKDYGLSEAQGREAFDR